MSLYDRSKAEIEDLHRCQLEWCTGQVTDETAAWERINRSWAEGFRLVDGEGVSEGSKLLLALQVRFNERVDDALQAVWVEGFMGYAVAEDLFQACYEEWTRTASGQERGRVWSVLLRSTGAGPDELEWVHAHRSWLGAETKPSFPPPLALEAEPVAVEAPDYDDDGVPDDVPWGRFAGTDDAREVVAPASAPEEVSPEMEIRAFFGDAEAQGELGGGPPPEFDQHDPDCWLRVLRKGGAEAVLRAGLVVLGHLLEPWGEFFPQESEPREIHAALTRYLAGDAEALAEAQALVETVSECATLAKEFEPEDPEEPLPDGFRTYVQLTNAAEAAARLGAGAGGSAIALGVKLSPVLEALPQELRLALRPEVLEAFRVGG